MHGFWRRRTGKHAKRITGFDVAEWAFSFLGDLTLYFLITVALETKFPGIGRLPKFFLSVAGLVFLKLRLRHFILEDEVLRAK